jgi:hypothetical protein
MIMKYFLFIITFFIISCTSTPVPIYDAEFTPEKRIYYKSKNPNRDGAIAVFIRDRSMHGKWVHANLFINEKHAADIDVGERVDFILDPNEYIFSVKLTDSLGLTISDSLNQTLQSGKEYYYRIFMDAYSWRIQRVHPALQNSQ